METATDFIFLDSKITADIDCSHEMRRYLILCRKAMTNLDSVLKSRGITLPTKVCAVKATVLLFFFSVVLYKWESWTIKKAECQRIDAFELWRSRRLLRVPWIARRSNQSILKEFNLEWSLEGLMLKLPYFGHLMWRADPLEKPLSWEQLRTGGEGNNKGWDGWMASSPPNWWTWVWANSRRWWRTGKPWESQRIRHNWLTNFNCFVCLLKSKSNSVSSH